MLNLFAFVGNRGMKPEGTRPYVIVFSRSRYSRFFNGSIKYIVKKCSPNGLLLNKSVFKRYNERKELESIIDILLSDKSSVVIVRQRLNIAFDKLYHDAGIILTFGILFAILLALIGFGFVCIFTYSKVNIKNTKYYKNVFNLDFVYGLCWSRSSGLFDCKKNILLGKITLRSS